jgi:hypothetical protein
MVMTAVCFTFFPPLGASLAAGASGQQERGEQRDERDGGHASLHR